MSGLINLLPAYGRVATIRTMDQARESWVKGQDWKFIHGPYTSIRDREMLRKLSDDGKIFLHIRNERGRLQPVEVTDLMQCYHCGGETDTESAKPLTAMNGEEVLLCSICYQRENESPNPNYS